MFFSPSLNIFVNPALKDDYINVNSWPDDAVEVDEQVYIEFSGLPPKGKIRIAGKMVFLHGLKFHHQRMRNRLPQPN
ncbi:CPS-53 (KpLE1) prophage protein [Escherichia coli]|uniref:CPS-53 (KpLE1) prophage protein n=1 Tax=Escherichia coli TaxID=562 RepID=A0A2X1MZJ6_ECOLX|nr:CPS-53 (KpLE1) prophage protein [Escherichia coli]